MIIQGRSLKNIPLFYIPATVCCLFLIASCAVLPRDYPKNTPFVYEYNINIEGDLPKEEKAKLQTGLKNQLDDSIRVRAVRKPFYRFRFNQPVLEKPPVYESSNADKSVIFMRSLLNSLGYFRDSIHYDTTLQVVKDDQYRTTVNFTVIPGEVVRLDSVSYHIKQEELQQITAANMDEALVKKGDPFARATISQELDRLAELYRNNGYLRFSREELIGLWDTLNPAILNPSADPFEQIALLDSIRRSRQKPLANLEFRLKPGFDSSRLTKYYVGNITVYPDYNPTQDTTGLVLQKEVIDRVSVAYYRRLFKPKILPQNIYFRPGDLYQQRRYYKTVNRFNAMGAWRLVSVEPLPRANEDTTDFVIRLTPARKYSFTANLEGSRNQSAFSGNLFGIAVTLGLQNRNFARSANQSITNIRYNIETGRDTVADVKFVQTRQLILGHTIYFPRPIPNLRFIPEMLRDNFRTVLSVNAATTERRSLYNLNTFNFSWGYEFQWDNKRFTLRIPNIEYSSLLPKPKLEEIFLNNPSLRNIFTDGFISSIIAGYTVTGGKNENVNVFRANMESSGLVTGLVRNKFLDTNLYRFIKVDLDFAQKFKFNKSALVFRVFAGVGYELNSTVNPRKRNSLPFFRQYFAGGPNSMRAWALRKLGPGSVVRDFGTTGVPDRYGDVQLEANIEYRFPFFNLSGVGVEGAIFTDIGNVWFLKKEAGAPEEVFNISRLGKDIAIGTGFGFRVDLSFFVIRLDYSFKAKNPSPSVEEGQNKWFYGTQLLKGQLQLGISYPFIQ